MIKTVFIDLALNMKTFGMDGINKRFENQALLTQKTRPEQEKELDALLNDGWTVVHTSQVPVDRDNGNHVVYRATFVLYKHEGSEDRL